MLYFILILQLIQLILIVYLLIDFGGSLGWIERYIGIKKLD